MRSKHLLVMSSFLYTLLGLAVGSLHCSVRQQISPCTCSYDVLTGPYIVNVACEKMTSFSEVKDALKGHFSPAVKIRLRITRSTLEDLAVEEASGFSDLQLWVYHLNISDNNLTTLRAESFSSLGNVTFLSAADNLLTNVPVSALKRMTRMRTLNLGGNLLTVLRDSDLQDLENLENLVLSDNDITEIGKSSFPRRMAKLAIARNQLTSLNDSLRDLTSLEWLYMDHNSLTTLDGQLPSSPGNKLSMVNASYNLLQSLPSDMRSHSFLDTVYADHNEIRTLGGALQRSRRMDKFYATYNQITSLAEDEFLDMESLTELLLGHNRLTELNGAIRSLRNLRRLSLPHNELPEFDLSEVRGLLFLVEIDLRYNHIERLVGQMENLVEFDSRVTELRLGHNRLSTLDGFLLGLPGLRTLDLSHNLLRHLPPNELIGLDKLRFLDLSHNKITSFADTSKKFLPSLETLMAGHNSLRTLDRDLHGLPVLCMADLSFNNITYVSQEAAAGSACLVRGVPGTLRIMLPGNLLRCNRDLFLAQEASENLHAELIGAPECVTYENEPEATVVTPIDELDFIAAASSLDFMDILKSSALEPEIQEELEPEISNMALQPKPRLEVDEVGYSDGPVNDELSEEKELQQTSLMSPYLGHETKLLNVSIAPLDNQ